MATSTGKTVALILLVVIILLVGLRMTPLFIAPFGVFTSAVQTLKSGANSLNIWPYKIHWSSVSFFSLILLILWIAVIVWVYKDAERRGMNGVLWALLVLIGNLIGLIIYLIIRTDTIPESDEEEEEDTKLPCPSCKKPVEPGYAFCPHCGARLQEGCPKCGESVEANWKACPHCGEKLGS
jgi:hypothetical protein